MKILGISGSPRKEDTSGVHTLVQRVLDHTGMETELISLRGKRYPAALPAWAVSRTMSAR